MRKVASVLSICIIAGLLIVYVPNIIAGAGKIGDTVNAMKTADLPFGKALYAAFLYGTFQLANVAVFVQHAKSFEKPQDAGKSMAVGAVLNALLMIMVVLNHDRIPEPGNDPAERPDIIYGSAGRRQ